MNAATKNLKSWSIDHLIHGIITRGQDSKSAKPLVRELTRRSISKADALNLVTFEINAREIERLNSLRDTDAHLRPQWS